MKTETYKYTIHSVVKQLILRYKKWRVMNEIRQLGFDMQCGVMTYEHYKSDYDCLSKQYDNLK